MTVLEPETLEDFDFSVPCEVRSCDPRTAEWKCITACCAWIILMCDPHKQEWLRYSAAGGGWICDKCDTTLIGNPFTSVEKL